MKSKIMKTTHINILKFIGIALVFTLTIVYTDPSYSSGIAEAQHSQAQVNDRPLPSREKAEDVSHSNGWPASGKAEDRPVRRIEGWVVPDFGFTPYQPTFRPQGLRLESVGVLDTLEEGNYYSYYKLNGKRVVQIYQAVGLGYDWDYEPDLIELPWGTAEIGANEINEPYGVPSWTALVRPAAEERQRAPNVVVILETPDKKMLLKLVESLEPVVN